MVGVALWSVGPLGGFALAAESGGSLITIATKLLVGLLTLAAPILLGLAFVAPAQLLRFAAAVAPLSLVRVMGETPPLFGFVMLTKALLLVGLGGVGCGPIRIGCHDLRAYPATTAVRPVPLVRPARRAGDSDGSVAASSARRAMRPFVWRAVRARPCAAAADPCAAAGPWPVGGLDLSLC